MITRDLFSSLWVEKFRPQTLSDIVLAPEVRSWFENALLKDKQIPHLLFVSPPGTGKTSLAKIIVNTLGCSYRYINASDKNGIDNIRNEVTSFAQTVSLDGDLKAFILDEADGLTSEGQRALRNIMEEYSSNIRFILTANYKNRISEPIRSRTQVFELQPPLKEVIARVVDIITKEGISVASEQKENLLSLIKKNYPDIRKIINALQKNIKDGVFTLVNNDKDNAFALDVIKKLEAKESIDAIREFVIQNEVEFASDYNDLLKSLFDVVFERVTDENKKSKALLIIGEYMYRHQFVLDHEINCFCCLMLLKGAI